MWVKRGEEASVYSVMVVKKSMNMSSLSNYTSVSLPTTNQKSLDACDHDANFTTLGFPYRVSLSVVIFNTLP